MEEEYEGQFMETVTAKELMVLMNDAIEILESIMEYGEECYNLIVRNDCNIPETQANYFEYVENICFTHPVVMYGMPEISLAEEDIDIIREIQSKTIIFQQLAEKIELNNIIIGDF
jgi:hypothetical protein